MILVDNFNDERTVNFFTQRDSSSRPPTAEPVRTLALLDEQGSATRIPPREGFQLAGRCAPSELILSDAMESRPHCRFERRRNDIVLHNLNSTNGTLVENAQVEIRTILWHVQLAIGGHSPGYDRSTMRELGGQRLAVEIDERRMAAEVAEITRSEYFRALVERTRARTLRRSDRTRK